MFVQRHEALSEKAAARERELDRERRARLQRVAERQREKEKAAEAKRKSEVLTFSLLITNFQPVFSQQSWFSFEYRKLNALSRVAKLALLDFGPIVGCLCRQPPSSKLRQTLRHIMLLPETTASLLCCCPTTSCSSAVLARDPFSCRLP